MRWILPALMLFPFMAKEIHLLFVKHVEDTICVHKGAERHLHQGGMASEDCVICDFTFSNFEVPDDIPPVRARVVFAAAVPGDYVHFHHSVLLLTYALRGPPAG